MSATFYARIKDTDLYIACQFGEHRITGKRIMRVWLPATDDDGKPGMSPSVINRLLPENTSSNPLLYELPWHMQKRDEFDEMVISTNKILSETERNPMLDNETKRKLLLLIWGAIGIENGGEDKEMQRRVSTYKSEVSRRVDRFIEKEESTA